MSLTRQLPVWSPITLGAVVAGARAAWCTDGTRARRELDESLRREFGPLGLYLTNSGTSALTLALRAASAVTDAPVALPAYCCYDVATAAEGAPVPFLLYDLDPQTLSPALASLRRAFAAGARSVVVAHLYGVPADLAAVQSLAEEFGAFVIEDAAQGTGCVWKGRPAGAHGHLGILSFGRGKGVTGGKGGALLVNDRGLLSAVGAAWESKQGPSKPRGSVMDLVVLAAQWLFGRPWLFWIPASLPWLRLGETIYKRPQQVSGLSTLAAGVLTRTLPLRSEEACRRRENALRFLARGASLTPLGESSGWQAGWLRFPVAPQRAADPGQLSQLSAVGVARGYSGTLADLPGFGGRRLNGEEEFEGARLLAERLVTLPTHRFVRSAKVPVF